MTPPKVVTVNPQLCVGCKQCQMHCSYAHFGVYSRSMAQIKLVTFEEICLNIPVACAYCEDAPCEKACPTGAMSHDPETGYAKVDKTRCIGCKECANACPVSVIDLNPVTHVAMRCDLCGGDPTCVKVCPKGALKFEDYSLSLQKKRRRHAEEMGAKELGKEGIKI